MAFNQPPGRGRRNSNDDGPDWGNMFGKLALAALGGLAVGAGVLAVANAVRNDSEEEGDQKTTGKKQQDDRKRSSKRKVEEILIGIDANPNTGGGILVIPQIETVYYYSADLTKHFKFKNEPDKFEMVNAFVALEIFDEYVEKNCKRCKAEVLTDNNFCSKNYSSRTKKSGYKALQQRITERLEDHPYNGEWKQVSRDDVHVKIADKLSNEKFAAAEEAISEKYPDYLQERLLDTDEVVQWVSEEIRKMAEEYPELLEILK